LIYTNLYTALKTDAVDFHYCVIGYTKDKYAIL